MSEQRFQVRIPAGADLSPGMRRQIRELEGVELVENPPAGPDETEAPAAIVNYLAAESEELARRRVSRIAYIDEDRLVATPHA